MELQQTGPIYKILTREQWASAQAAGVFEGSGIDLQDGFIHFSTAKQLKTTAEKHFSGQSNLLVFAVDPLDLGSQLKWEPSRNNDLFPHLYAGVQLGQVKNIWPLDWENDSGFLFPPEILDSKQ